MRHFWAKQLVGAPLPEVIPPGWIEGEPTADPHKRIIRFFRGPGRAAFGIHAWPLDEVEGRGEVSLSFNERPGGQLAMAEVVGLFCPNWEVDKVLWPEIASFKATHMLIRRKP